MSRDRCYEVPGMQHWLFKSEPDSYSFDQLEQDGQTEWSGVRNYQARNFMKTMKIGDLGFFYHSSTTPPGIIGVCRVTREAHPDFTAIDPESEYFDARSTEENTIWEMVDLAFESRLGRYLSLDFLRTQPTLSAMPLLQKGGRLSIQQVTPTQWDTIIELAQE